MQMIQRLSIPHLFLATRLLGSPLEALYSLLIFIVAKELNASPLALVILACSKPIVSLFAFYISTFMTNKSHRFQVYLLTLNLVGALPCLLFPYMQNVWFYVIAYALFMTTLRAAFPVWMEILKKELGVKEMGNLISKGTSINYGVVLFIPLFFSYWMDQQPDHWKTLFLGLALFQLFNTWFLLCLPSPSRSKTDSQSFSPSFRTVLLTPWKNAWHLLSKHSDFAHYLFMFFLGGAGLVAMQPVLPIFFKESLHLSYTELTLAVSFCKGAAFICTAFLWAYGAKRLSLFSLNCYINLFSCLFIAFLLASTMQIHWLFLAYLMYGTMQAGCELSWNLSGPVFSKGNESTLYSSLNLVLVGVRGCLCPFIGQLIFLSSNASMVFITAGGLCFVSLLYAGWLSRDFKEENLCMYSQNKS